MIETFLKVCQDYQGTLQATPNGYEFYSNNRLISRYNNGETAKDKVVKCRMVYDDYGFGGDEGSCEIIGGFGIGEADETTMRYYFEKYNFQKKREEQLNLFDL